MTIREVAQQAGLSHQAVYKKIKARGYQLDALRDKETGQLTEEGEAVIKELFPAKVENEVEELRNKLATTEAMVERLQDEVNFLRQSLEREQQLHGLALAKLPAPPPALEAGRKTWWQRLFGKENAHNAK